jgi:hypothetical protein
MFTKIRCFRISILVVMTMTACEVPQSEKPIIQPPVMAWLPQGVALGMQAPELYRIRPDVVKDDYITWESGSAGESFSYWFHNRDQRKISHSGEILAAVRKEIYSVSMPSTTRDSILQDWERLEGPPTETIAGCLSLVGGKRHFVRIRIWRRASWVAAIEELYKAESQVGILQSLRMSVQLPFVPIEAVLPSAKALRETGTQNTGCS